MDEQQIVQMGAAEDHGSCKSFVAQASGPEVEVNEETGSTSSSSSFQVCQLRRGSETPLTSCSAASPSSTSASSESCCSSRASSLQMKTTPINCQQLSSLKQEQAEAMESQNGSLRPGATEGSGNNRKNSGGGSGNSSSDRRPEEYEKVKQVELFGVRIVALLINAKERLCLAQISNTLLKEFSYNEIHNRRVALGITCVQCTPIQLEMLRRAGAMPSSSRRCGMITMREAERLCRSFLVEEQPPELPENFYFTVAHRVNYGCKGRFVPARYISSRAKCIECFYCGEFYSPNKFIFHSHRQPHSSDCNPPDSPNINSWRKHIDLDWSQEHGQDIKYAWEDVKSLFNGGTRRRAPINAADLSTTQQPGKSSSFHNNPAAAQRQAPLRFPVAADPDPEQLIDVDDSATEQQAAVKQSENQGQFSGLGASAGDRTGKQRAAGRNWTTTHQSPHVGANPASSRQAAPVPSSLMLLNGSGNRSATNLIQGPVKRSVNSMQQQQHSISSNKRLITPVTQNLRQQDTVVHDSMSHNNNNNRMSGGHRSQQAPGMVQYSGNSSEAGDFLLAGSSARCQLQPSAICESPSQVDYSGRGHKAQVTSSSSLIYPNSAAPNLIYSQLYTQLMQPPQQPANHPPQLSSSMDAQLALRHHLWSSLLANLQCNSSQLQQIGANQQQQQQAYSRQLGPPIQQQPPPKAGISNSNSTHLFGATNPSAGQPQLSDSGDLPGAQQSAAQAAAAAAANLSHLISAQLYSAQHQQAGSNQQLVVGQNNKLPRLTNNQSNGSHIMDPYKVAQTNAISYSPHLSHKFPSSETTNDL